MSSDPQHVSEPARELSRRLHRTPNKSRFELPEHCPDCDGAGWVPGDGDAKRCECFYRELVGRRIAYARIPDTYSDCSMESFEFDRTETTASAYRTAVEFVEAWPTKRGLVFTGSPGSGKTHLAVSAMRGVLQEHRTTGRFVSVPSLYTRLQATFSKDSEESEGQILSEMQGIGVLLLDDLGARRDTEWAHDVLTLIVTSRYEAGRPTLITSNRTGKDFRKLVGERLYSRLLQISTATRIQAPDYRQERQAARERTG